MGRSKPGHVAVYRQNPKFENFNYTSPPRVHKARFALAQKSIFPCHYQRLHVGQVMGPPQPVLLLPRIAFFLVIIARSWARKAHFSLSLSALAGHGATKARFSFCTEKHFSLSIVGLACWPGHDYQLIAMTSWPLAVVVSNGQCHHMHVASGRRTSLVEEQFLL